MLAHSNQQYQFLQNHFSNYFQILDYNIELDEAKEMLKYSKVNSLEFQR